MCLIEKFAYIKMDIATKVIFGRNNVFMNEEIDDFETEGMEIDKFIDKHFKRPETLKGKISAIVYFKCTKEFSGYYNVIPYRVETNIKGTIDTVWGKKEELPGKVRVILRGNKNPVKKQ